MSVEPLARSEELSLRELIPAEVTLETIGFFTPSSKRLKKKVKTLTFAFRNPAGEGETTTVEIIPNVKVGLPITIDLDYYRAFQKVLFEFLQAGGDLDGPIPFSTRQLIQYAGKSYGSHQRANVRTWLERMVGTTISCRVYNHKTRSYVTLDGPPFSQVMTKGDDLGNGEMVETSAVWLAPYYKKTFAAGYIRPVDLELHNSLQTYTAKHLYPMLETGFHASGDKGYSKSYSDLCEDLELKRYKHRSRVAEQLDPSFRELREREYVESWSYRESKRKTDFVITTRPGKRYFDTKKEQAQRKDRWLALEREKASSSDERTMAEQAQLIEEITSVCGGSTTDFAYLNLVKKKSPELIRTALTETRLAHRNGQIKKTKRQYFFWMLKQLEAERAASAAD